MPNITWQEPQILVELLALNLLSQRSGMAIPGPKEVALISPWISDVEIRMRSKRWNQLSVGESGRSCTIGSALQDFHNDGWSTHVATLAYGETLGGLTKDPDSPSSRRERRFLTALIQAGVLVYLLRGLHAKGVVTPLAVITGSTNLTKGGLFGQMQNTNYFAHDHPDYGSNRRQLVAKFQGVTPETAPLI
jgi:hypothetical protein